MDDTDNVKRETKNALMIAVNIKCTKIFPYSSFQLIRTFNDDPLYKIKFYLKSSKLANVPFERYPLINQMARKIKCAKDKSNGIK